MPLLETTVECPMHDSFRVQQLAGLFDVPLAEKCRERFAAEIPAIDEGWTIGAVYVEPQLRSPKTHPRESASRHVERPVGLEPVEHIIMARHRDEPPRDGARANRLAHRRGADLRGRA
ncbi:MAG TPA: hypothetical protein VHB99_09355, partial [Pirellulales bacterium]|nr:hypothetical protein [Pirellulales bacterium]